MTNEYECEIQLTALKIEQRDSKLSNFLLTRLTSFPTISSFMRFIQN